MPGRGHGRQRGPGVSGRVEYFMRGNGRAGRMALASGHVYPVIDHARRDSTAWRGNAGLPRPSVGRGMVLFHGPNVAGNPTTRDDVDPVVDHGRRQMLAL